MVHSPPLSPKVATPLARRKRRYSALDRASVDLSAQVDAIRNGLTGALPISTTPMKGNGVAHAHAPPQQANERDDVRRLDDGDLDDDDDDKSLFEDLLDTADIEPYRAGKHYIIDHARRLLTIS